MQEKNNNTKKALVRFSICFVTVIKRPACFMSQSQVVYDSLKDGNLATSACLNNNQKVIRHLDGGDSNNLL